MKRSKKTIRYFTLSAISAVFLASCQQVQDDDQSELPAQVVSQLEKVTKEELSQASYQIHRYGPIKAYVVALSDGFCGSGGCETFILVEKDGKVKKIYNDLGGNVTVVPVFPDQLRFTIGRSGSVCGQSYNSAPCSLVMTWPKGTQSWNR